MQPLSFEEACFFEKAPQAQPLYEALRALVQRAEPGAAFRVQRTQISFYNRRLFAAASFTPVRRAKERPSPFLTLTFGLARRLESPRIDAAVEPYPGRWTHHVMLGSVDEIDAELCAWLQEAAAFANSKR